MWMWKAVWNFFTGTKRRPRQSKSSQNSKNSLVEGNRKRLAPPSDDDGSPCKKAKSTRSIDVGWMDFDKRTGEYKLVRSKKGGPGRALNVDADTNVHNLLPEIRSLFFPGGISPRGRTEEFDFELRDYKLSKIKQQTVSTIYKETKVKRLRINLCSKRKEDTNEHILRMAQLSTINDQERIRLERETQHSVLPTHYFSTAAETRNLDFGDNRLGFDQRKLTIPGRGGIQKTVTRETLPLILLRLEKRISESSQNHVKVHRANLLQVAFREMSRSTFDLWGKCSVKFLGENIPAEQAFGEFLSEAIKQSKQLPIFAGEESKMIVLNFTALKDNLYYKTGKLFAYSIVHSGPFPSFLHPLLYSLIVDENISTNSTLDGLSNPFPGNKVSVSPSIEGYVKAILAGQNANQMAGGMSQTSHPNQQSVLAKGVTKHLTEAIEQFKKGLESMGLVSEMKRNSDEWKQVFLSSSNCS